MLEFKQIRSQLARHKLTNSVVINCRRVGELPQMDMIRDWDELPSFPFSDPDLRKLGEELAVTLCDKPEAKLVILCDLDVEGNTPPPGHKWTPKDQTKGAVYGIMSCLKTVARNGTVRSLLNNRPNRLVVAVVQKDKIKVQKNCGEKMVALLHEQERRR